MGIYKKIRKNDKGAALIIVLFTLVIVSVFMSLMYAVSRKQILSETKERQSSLYSQYIKTTLDIVVSPLIMGNADNTSNDDFAITNVPNIPNIIILNWSGNVQNNGYTFDLYYSLGNNQNNNNNLWILNRINIIRRRINNVLTIIPTYDMTINTVVAQLNNQPTGSFDNIVSALNNNQIKYSGRAIATVVQRTPYNISTNTALFVKHPMMWVPFAADPFVALNSVNNIDKSVGITNGYEIKGDLSTPNLNPNDVFSAFRNVSNSPAINTSGLTGVWDGTTPDRLVSGGSATGYVNVFVNQNNLANANDFSIKNYKTKDVNNNNAYNNGKIPGADNNGNIDLFKINNNQRVTININDSRAILVGSNSNGEITRAPATGGLIEMIWPTDNNNNFMPNNDTARAIVNSYPPKYATVYIVPEGDKLRIFAVGGYSKRKVNVNSLLSNINNIPTNGRTVDTTNNEIIIDLNRLNDTERNTLAAINVNGGNLVIMPNNSNNNALYYVENNQPKPFDLTVIATRFGNTDNLNNRSFYDTNSQNDLGSWSIPNNFNPNDGQISLGGSGARYIIPSESDTNWDNRKQVVRALEGNVIIQNFRDNNFDFRQQSNENNGFIGYNNNNGQRFITVNNRPVPIKPINVLSQNYVILNYQNNSLNDHYLSANIIAYKGSLTIPDRDIYRWLMDGGRFNNNEYDSFQNLIVSDKNLVWYGKYISNFASVEGVVDPNNPSRIIGFSNVSMTASDNSDLGKGMPPVKRKDWFITINGKMVILYDIVRFEINK